MKGLNLMSCPYDINAKYKMKANWEGLPVLKEINGERLILLPVLHIIIFTDKLICLDNDP